VGSSMPCTDCGADTEELREYYMVHDRIWREAGMRRGYLCIGCLERRLGRELTPGDFTSCLLNDQNAGGYGSGRLVSRLTGHGHHQ
jgi:hypothetical protein